MTKTASKLVNHSDERDLRTHYDKFEQKIVTLHQQLWPGQPIPGKLLPKQSSGCHSQDATFFEKTISTSLFASYVACTFANVNSTRRLTSKLFRCMIQTASAHRFTSCRLNRHSLHSNTSQIQEFSWDNNGISNPHRLFDEDYAASIQSMWEEAQLSSDKPWVNSTFQNFNVADLICFSLVPLSWQEKNKGKLRARELLAKVMRELHSNALLIIANLAVFIDANIRKLAVSTTDSTGYFMRKKPRMVVELKNSICADAAQILFAGTVARICIEL